MEFAKRMRGVAAFSMAMLIGCGLTVPLAHAEYIVNLVQQGNDVIATGSGTLDLAALTLTCSSGCSTNGGINPMLASIGIGPAFSVPSRFYSGFTGPASFGIGDFTPVSGGSGDTVAFDGTFNILSVPLDYVSGNALSGDSIYNDQTFESLGVTPGTYVWTWGTGATADSITMNVGAVPEPSSLALLSLPLGLVLRLTARRRL